MTRKSEKMKVLYIGNEERIIYYLSRIHDIEVVACICQEGKFSYANISQYDIKIVSVKSKSEFVEKIESYYHMVDFAIMYSFGIIVPPEVVKNMKIYNFHPGDLRTNRGSSPINWSILLGERTTKMTLHSIDEGIDTGMILLERECPIYENDVPYTLQMRMEGEIPSMVLDLLCLREKHYAGYSVGNGVYRKRIIEEDYTIKDGDSRDTVYAKIRSQYKYKGAIYLCGNTKYYIKSLKEFELIRKNPNIIECSNSSVES